MQIKRTKRYFIFRFIRWSWRRLLYSLKHLRGEPYQIAWGGAVGIFIAFTPTFGVQSVVAFVAATLLKVNRIIAIAMTWVTNIFTIVPIYYVTCLIGKKVLRQTIEYEYLKNVEWRNWGSVWEFIMNNFYALWAGALIVGILAAGATFVVLYYMTRYYHLLREKRKLKGRIHQA